MTLERAVPANGHAPEIGYASLRLLARYRDRVGLGIERDRSFKGQWPVSVYAEAARQAGRIVEFGPELEQAVANHRQSIRD